MTLNGQNALCRRKDASLEPTAQMWMKIDPYYQRQKCRPMSLVSGNIRFMGIFTGVSLSGVVKWQWCCRRRQFLAICVATSSETSEIRPAILAYMAICYPLSACNWLQNKWPRMTLSANFTSKSVFDQQGCRALTFALARLSCLFLSSPWSPTATRKPCYRKDDCERHIKACKSFILNINFTVHHHNLLYRALYQLGL